VTPPLEGPLDISSSWAGHFGAIAADYEQISGCSDSPATLNMSFSGPTLFAPPTNVAPFVTLTTPVNFSGQFIHVLDPTQPVFNQPVFTEELIATARATVALQRFDFGNGIGNVWEFTGATYNLSPVPEPATLLLFGTTMAGLGLARWRRRRQS